MSLSRLFSELTAAFEKFDDPQLEARHLLIEALNIDLNTLILRGDAAVSAADLERIGSWREDRLRGVPLAYLSGHKAFYKSDFIVRPGVLIPRPETEFVVEAALARGPQSKWIADLGCGSGCIGLSLLKEIPGSHLIAVEASAAAAEVTRENAVKLNLAERVEVAQSPVEKWACERTLDLVVANPPYIASGDSRVQKSVHDFEPHEALYAADNGLEFVRSWAAKSFSLLRPGGVIVIEFGSGQTDPVQEIMRSTGFRELQITRDLQGIDRVISGIKPE